MSRKIALVAKGRSTYKALERGVTASTDRSVALQFTLVREYLFTWWTWLAVGTVGSHHVLFQWMVVAKLFIAVATLVVWALKWRQIQHCRVCMVSTQKGLESTILTDLVQFNGLHYFDVMQCHSFFFTANWDIAKRGNRLHGEIVIIFFWIPIAHGLVAEFTALSNNMFTINFSITSRVPFR